VEKMGRRRVWRHFDALDGIDSPSTRLHSLRASIHIVPETPFFWLLVQLRRLVHLVTLSPDSKAQDISVKVVMEERPISTVTA
jgi:hypothetical protein